MTKMRLAKWTMFWLGVVVIVFWLQNFAFAQSVTNIIPAPQSGEQSKQPELKCGKYQHVYHWPGSCGPAWCDEKSMTCNAVCTTPPPDRCVDDMHEVTEREWQSLMEMLDAIKIELQHANQVASK